MRSAKAEFAVCRFAYCRFEPMALAKEAGLHPNAIQIWEDK
jgi:hypothetical protein